MNTAYDNWIRTLRTRKPRMTKQASRAVTFGQWLGTYCQQRQMQKHAGFMRDVWDTAKDVAKETPVTAWKATKYMVTRPWEWGKHMYQGYSNMFKGHPGIDISKETNNIGYVSKRDTKYRPYYESIQKGLQEANAAVENNKGLDDPARKYVDSYEKAVQHMGVIDGKTWDQVKSDTPQAVEYLRKHFYGDDAKVNEFLKLYGAYGSRAGSEYMYGKHDRGGSDAIPNHMGRVERDIIQAPVVGAWNGFTGLVPALRIDNSRQMNRAMEYLGGPEAEGVVDAGQLGDLSGNALQWRLLGPYAGGWKTMSALSGYQRAMPYIRKARNNFINEHFPALAGSRDDMTTYPTAGDLARRRQDIANNLMQQNPGMTMDQALKAADDYNTYGSMASIFEDINNHEKELGSADPAYRFKVINRLLTGSYAVPEELWSSQEFRSLSQEDRMKLYANRLTYAAVRDFNAREGGGGPIRNILNKMKPGDQMDEIVKQAVSMGRGSSLCNELQTMMPYMLNDKVDQMLAGKGGEGNGQAWRMLKAICNYAPEQQVRSVLSSFNAIDDKRLRAMMEQGLLSGNGKVSPELNALVNDTKFGDYFISDILGPRMANQESRAMLLPAAVKMMANAGNTPSPEFDALAGRTIDLIANVDDWDKTFKQMSAKDMMDTAKMLQAMDGKPMSPYIVEKFGGAQNFEAFKERFKAQAQKGVMQSMLNPSKMHAALGLWLESKGMGGLGKFIGDNPWAFWAIAIGVLGIGGAMLWNNDSADDEEQADKLRSLLSSDAASLYERNYLR